MIAAEMSDTRNRGKILWVLASSRPDLIEVDLKRPGRIDVKVPIFPAVDAQQGGALLAALCRRRGLKITEEEMAGLEPRIPQLADAGRGRGGGGRRLPAEPDRGIVAGRGAARVPRRLPSAGPAGGDHRPDETGGGGGHRCGVCAGRGERDFVAGRS